MWFWKIMRRFFLSLDSVLFNFIDVLYDLLMSISRTSILTQGEIAQFAQRIELLLGIFMLFKLSFSLITYVVNPDDFSDKQKGFGKLIQSAVISLLMLVLVPYAFQMAFNLQTKILEGNILAKLILGEDEEADGNDNFLNTAGEEMAFSVMLPFFKPNYSINNSTGVDLADCINIYEKDDNNNNVFSQTCKDALRESGMETTPLENYSNGITERSLGLTFRIEAALSTTGEDDTEDFLIDYMAPISTVVAVVVCLLLVTFCIDIGVRNVKLAFLQLIYPIPVISYMDPKSGKDGLFKKWYQMCFSTFLSLFIRLLALYFGVYIISKVGSLGVYDVVTGSQITNGWVMIFVIIGVLMFIKQLPKILENLGIKLDGDGKFTLNPLKKIEEGAIGGKRIIGGAKRTAKGAALAGLAGAAAYGSNLLSAPSRFKNAKGWRGKLNAATGTLFGGLSAIRRGATAGLKNEKLGKGFTDSYSEAMNSLKKKQERANAGTGAFRTALTRTQKKFGLSTANDKAEQLRKIAKDIQSNYDAIKNQANSTDTDTLTINGQNYKGAKEASKVLEALKSSSLNRADYASDAAFNQAINSRKQSIEDIENALDARYQDLANTKDSLYSKLMTNMKNSAADANKISNQFDIGDIIDTKNFGDIKKMNGQSKSVDAHLMSDKKAQKAAATEEYLKNNK